MTAAPVRRVGASVAEVSSAAYTIPTDLPEADGTIAWDSTTLVLIQARAGDVTGTGWTYAAPPAAAVVRDLLAPVVVGTDPLDVAATFETMVRAVRNAGRPGLVGMAISAVDVALWDLKARLLEVPLHRLLGSHRDRVPVYGSGGFTTYDDAALARQVTGWLEQDIPRMKIKIGESWGSAVERDLTRMRQVRTLAGDDVELFVDANGGYRAGQAIRVMERAADLDIRWFEEPVSSDDLAGLRRVRDAVTADVAAGEYGFDLTYFRRMCQAEAVDCLQVDLSRCGGITEWLRAAAVAASHGLEVSAHCAPHLHAAAASAIPNLRHLEWFHDHVRIEARAFEGAAGTAPGGWLQLPDGPGHGLTWRGEMEDQRVA